MQDKRPARESWRRLRRHSAKIPARLSLGKAENLGDLTRPQPVLGPVTSESGRGLVKEPVNRPGTVAEQLEQLGEATQKAAFI